MATNGGTAQWLVRSRKIAFWGGLAGVGYETIFEEVDRPWLFLCFLTMMGLAQFSRIFDLLGKGNGGITISFGGSSNPTAPPREQ